MDTRRKLLVISDVMVPGLPFTGGSIRSMKSIKEYTKHYDVYLLTPCPELYRDAVARTRLVRELSMVKLLWFSLKISLAEPLYNKTNCLLYATIPLFVYRGLIKIENPPMHPDAIVLLNEAVKHVELGSMFKEKYNVPSMVLFQLPPFYSDKRRREQIARSFKMWYRVLYGDDLLGGAVRETLRLLDLIATNSRKIKRLYETHEVLVAVSKSVPFEMGEEWVSRFRVLDPGVALDREDLELVAQVREATKERRNTVVFGGRPDPVKGFVEGLIAFKALSKQYSSLKLVVTGHVSEKLKPRIERLVRRIGLEGKVALMGVVPRNERFRLVAEARLVLYPSHVDAYPYAVLEALHLGTPVVAYDIPAIRFNFGGNPGVRLVREGNIEALVNEAVDVLDSGDTTVEPPKPRSWEDIMKEELRILQELLEKR